MFTTTLSCGQNQLSGFVLIFFFYFFVSVPTAQIYIVVLFRGRILNYVKRRGESLPYVSLDFTGDNIDVNLECKYILWQSCCI